MNLLELTTQLQEKLNELKHKYDTSEQPEDKRDKDFFAYVKRETTPIYEQIELWEQQATEFVKQRKVRVHPQQVQSTTDNLKLLLMHSYYIDTRYHRYMELHQSVHYVLDMLINDINDN
ncbi:DUF1798 family protein [Radiobacillus sp. PE A8.2]|uniref:DUF1798 family protein n=1 Tax=Radiobacillus sp. PE A8.2 TaxID=3380349 RepID=UPI00388F2527